MLGRIDRVTFERIGGKVGEDPLFKLEVNWIEIARTCFVLMLILTDVSLSFFVGRKKDFRGKDCASCPRRRHRWRIISE